MKLIIASRNVHKIREFRAMLKALPQLDLLSLIDFPQYTPPPEAGATFKENAVLKAEHAAKTLHHYAIADDSGLVVPALGGAPGVISRRYAGERATDKENRQKLLSEMRDLHEGERQAYFECWIALSSPQGLEKCVQGIAEGEIIDREKGRLGFGYDSLFIKHEYGKTFAELEEEVKNRISHRRKALDKLLPYLESLIEKCPV
ncbi:MAG TPA: RdgB/HAM1 family non-canonical purine NTP pyrophosphatase [Rhabdochlamydiaceae bacterium]|jgi:XTP/dITP diphosphohydrolase